MKFDKYSVVKTILIILWEHFLSVKMKDIYRYVYKKYFVKKSWIAFGSGDEYSCLKGGIKDFHSDLDAGLGKFFMEDCQLSMQLLSFSFWPDFQWKGKVQLHKTHATYIFRHMGTISPHVSEYMCCIVTTIYNYTHIHAETKPTIMTNEYTSLEKYTSHTLFKMVAKGLQKGYVLGVSWRLNKQQHIDPQFLCL